MRVIWVMMMVAVIGVGCRRSTTGPGRGNGGGGDTTYYDPRNISRTETFSSSPALDVRGDHVVVVWNESDDGINSNHFDIMFKERVNGEWSEAINISNTTNFSATPDVAIDIYGNIHVVWEEIQDGVAKVYYRMRDAGGTWYPKEFLANGELPWIGSDERGNTHIFWIGSGSGPEYIKKTGSTWGTIVQLPYLLSENPSFYVTPSGHLYAVVEAGRGYPDIYLYEKRPGGDWSGPFNVSNNRYYCWSAGVYGTDDGRVYVSWEEAGLSRIRFRIRDADGRWGELETLPGVVGGPWDSFFWGSGDTLIAVWDEKTDNWEVYYRMRIGNEWGEKVNITNTAGNSLMGLFPKIKDGKLYIAWSDSTDGNWDIFYDTIDLN